MTWPMAARPEAPVAAMAAVDQGRHLVVAELGREVTGQHRVLGPLGGGLLVPARILERGGGLAAALGLPGQDLEYVVVAELAGGLPGHFLVTHRGQCHPESPGSYLVPGFHRGGEVGAEPILECWHGAYPAVTPRHQSNR